MQAIYHLVLELEEALEIILCKDVICGLENCGS